RRIRQECKTPTNGFQSISCALKREREREKKYGIRYLEGFESILSTKQLLQRRLLLASRQTIQRLQHLDRTRQSRRLDTAHQDSAQADTSLEEIGMTDNVLTTFVQDLVINVLKSLHWIRQD